MSLAGGIIEKFNRNSMDRKVFSLLATLIVIVGLFIAAGLLFPTTVSIVLNILWIILVTFLVIFFVLGVLVIVGMRSEAGRVLDAFLEGSLKIIDFLDLVRSLWNRFVQMLKDFMLFAAPFIAYALALIVYVLLLIIYKSVGGSHDVTLLTIIITVVAIGGFGLISKPVAETEDYTWKKQFFKRLKAGFIDGLEIVLFIFFLTMDNTNVFFLPDNLNIPLKAEWGGYDFMVRGYVYTNHMRTTLNIILTTIMLEILRNLLRIFAGARKYYLEYTHSLLSEENKSALIIIKNSIRKSFGDSKDDLTKFITFNTVLFIVFLLFPRLKLFALLITSITNLLLDLTIRSRIMTKRRGTDLISRGLAKLFRL